ncbi:MAG: AtpZ/AtpI family protein [Terracidiphilus sp.]|jgi:F0F1-type ATP synthase assembly protein I
MPFNRPIPDSNPKSKTSVGIGAVVQAETMLQIAFVLPSAAVIGWLLGAWADHSFHQSWIGLAGLIFGFISGMFYVIRLAMTTEKNTRPDTKTGGDAGKGTPPPQS